MNLYPPPEILKAEVFARLPDSLRRIGRRSAWADANKRGEELHSFLEGPAFDAAGNLWLVDIPWGRILRLSPDGVFTVVAEYDGEPNGLAFHRDGRLFIADYKLGILVLDPATGRIEPVLERNRGERFKGVNDLVFSAGGDLYFTDQGQTGLHDPTGRLYRLSADGRLTCLFDTLPSPNGLVPNRAETAIYVAVTRANAIWRVPLAMDGTTSKVGLFIQISGGLSGPDGLALDADGGLWVAHAGNGCVWGFDRLGAAKWRIVSEVGLFTTNIAFGGPDGRWLYITESESGTVLRCRLTVSGKSLFGPENP
ncbi:SMP-30/gluconolactonase/LRE family protein [Azospirillum halopraeferens]|uniref:SMP-30/gluconolactonase/LRE family protein n=1 Tax=Azospirillum halopraeferens TaxID=34010 RepID=UPI0003FA0023|nr:SMP-30/gluconolactonase/LRE family protein [Azospirillum halopraeferens]